MEPPEAPRRAGATPWLVILALVAASGAAVLVIVGRPLEAGIAVAICGGALTAGTIGGGWASIPRYRFSHAVGERLSDAVILGAVAWSSVEERPVASAAALAALSAAYLEAYVRAKAVGLGFRMWGPSLDRYVHFLLVALGLVVTSLLQAALWFAAAFALLGVVRLAFQAAREEPS
jgi:hypothetical protein